MDKKNKKQEFREFHIPAITISGVHIDPKLNQKLDDLCMTGTDSIMKSSDSFIVGQTGILHLFVESE